MLVRCVHVMNFLEIGKKTVCVGRSPSDHNHNYNMYTDLNGKICPGKYEYLAKFRLEHVQEYTRALEESSSEESDDEEDEIIQKEAVSKHGETDEDQV